MYRRYMTVAQLYRMQAQMCVHLRLCSYAAPELLMGGKCSPKVDSYRCGCWTEWSGLMPLNISHPAQLPAMCLTLSHERLTSRRLLHMHVTFLLVLCAALAWCCGRSSPSRRRCEGTCGKSAMTRRRRKSRSCWRTASTST
jgi:hypothetical protein